MKFYIFLLLHMVDGRFPHCQFTWEMQLSRTRCEARLQEQSAQTNPGCLGEWDNVSCWLNAAVGEVTTLSCPTALLRLFGKNGKLSRNCTEAGWTPVYPAIAVACSSPSADEPNQLLFFRLVQLLSSLGHSLSFISLLSSSIIITFFRRLHCTRNFIHLNLFVSFMLRAAAVMTKDALLFSEDEGLDCSTPPSLVGCRTILVLFNYFIMANFFWLLVEGLYLHTLLLVVHRHCTRLFVYVLIGWGIPLVFIVAWIISRLCLEDTWCWEMNEKRVPDRLMNWPIMASVILNFILFLSIIRVLVQKLHCSDVSTNQQSQLRRLARSTLLLIPLFGINYVIFVYVMEPTNKTMKRIKICFELGLGSFQGLVVAVLYCFLNSEVQSELKRLWRSLSIKWHLHRNYPSHAVTVDPTACQLQRPRDRRVASILPTETSML